MTRRRFTASGATQLSAHDHVAWCGEGPGALERLAVAAFASAAAQGQRMVFVSDRPDPERLAALEGLELLLRRGALQLTTPEEVYGELFDPAAQLAHFEAELDRALDDGHTGMCVVADNTSLAGGSDEEFGAWLAWEATADQLQASRRVTGICYFDRRAVARERLADLAAVHPVLSTGFDAPSFQIFVDGDVVRVVGALDHWCADQLRRILTSFPKSDEMSLDLSGLEFIDHRALLVLNEVAEGHRLRVSAAKPIVRRIWDVLAVSSPALELC